MLKKLFYYSLLLPGHYHNGYGMEEVPPAKFIPYSDHIHAFYPKKLARAIASVISASSFELKIHRMQGRQLNEDHLYTRTSLHYKQQLSIVDKDVRSIPDLHLREHIPLVIHESTIRFCRYFEFSTESQQYETSGPVSSKACVAVRLE